MTAASEGPVGLGQVIDITGVEDHGTTNVEAADFATADPGLDALIAGLEASGRWLLANHAVAELLFWRPVPKFEPSPTAMAISQEMIDIQRDAFAVAVTGGQLRPGADSDEAVFRVSTMIIGVLSQAFANEPDLAWGTGRFTPPFTKPIRLLVAAYPTPSQRTRSLAFRRKHNF